MGEPIDRHRQGASYKDLATNRTEFLISLEFTVLFQNYGWIFGHFEEISDGWPRRDHTKF